MRLVLLTLAVSLAGWGSSAVVGSFDPREPVELTPRASLMIVPVGTAASVGSRSPAFNAAMGIRGFDTEGVAEFVPLDSLGAESYTDVAIEAIADAMRESGSWASVTIGALPEGVEMTEESYRVTRFVAARSKSLPKRTPVRAIAAGSVDAFGPAVDYVLFVYEPGLGFLDGRSVNFRPDPTMLFGITRRVEANAIAMRSEVVLWDDQAGVVRTMAEVGGTAPIRSRVFSAASERTPSALMNAMREDLAESIRRQIPVLFSDE